MIDTKGVAKALLQYRHTPVLGIWNSPAQMLLGRILKDALPRSPQKLLYKAWTMDYHKKYGMPRSAYWKHILTDR